MPALMNSSHMLYKPFYVMLPIAWNINEIYTIQYLPSSTLHSHNYVQHKKLGKTPAGLHPMIGGMRTRDRNGAF